MLAILNRLYHVDADSLGWWLCERQLPSGGLNGSTLTRNLFKDDADQFLFGNSLSVKCNA